MAKFCDRLKQSLFDNNMTQMYLAERLGIHKAMVSQYVSGKRFPNSNEKIIVIARILKVNPAWLAGFDVPKDNLNISNRDLALLALYGQLNDIGKDKVDDYVKDIADNDKYTQKADDEPILKKA